MPSLHMSRPSFWLRSYQQPEGLGRLSIPLSSWIYQKFSNSLDDKRIAKVMKMSNHEYVIRGRWRGLWARGHILELSPPGFKTDLSKGIVGQFLISLAKEMRNPLSPPRRHYAFVDLSDRSIGVQTITRAASSHDLPHSEWASGFDGTILRESDH